MKIMKIKSGLAACILAILAGALPAQETQVLEKTAAYDVVWDSPSENSLGSMPIGNGDIGMNVWVERDGQLNLYLSKTDAWSENGQLLKLGKIRISLDPNPFRSGSPFRQELDLIDGEIAIRAGKGSSQVEITVRVDANHPVGEIDIRSGKPVGIKVEAQPWRTTRRAMTAQEELVSVYGLPGSQMEPVYQEADNFPEPSGNRILWYHRNLRSVWKKNLELQALDDYAENNSDPLFYRTFGAAIEGTGMKPAGKLALVSESKTKACRISVYPLTSSPITERDWINQLSYGIEKINEAGDDQRLKAHRDWWHAFWNRSYIFVTPAAGQDDNGARAVTQGYILQRYLNACGGRGNYPIKFNGSIFTVDTYGRKNMGGYDADFRRWGGPFWFQNTRLPYWAMLEAGDFDLMGPLFRMYLNDLPIRKMATRKYYGHEGAFFPETLNFWGTYTNVNYGLNRAKMPDGLTENTYIRYYWTSGLELTAMMMDYYRFNGSSVFLKDTLLPMAKEVLEFYGKHWRRDIEGKILFTPAQSLETYQTAVNPTPDIAGLRFVLTGLLGMKSPGIGEDLRKSWQDLLDAIPDIPQRTVKGDKVIAPAAFSAQQSNIENPELYAIFPFRLFGTGKADIDLAINTFVHRKFRYNQGWQQSAIQAACLGLADEAADMVLDKFSHSDPECRFPAFWGPNYDWTPDQDHGSTAMIALQRMLLYYDGDTVVTFPAWPEKWSVEFRLHGPGGKVVVERR